MNDLKIDEYLLGTADFDKDLPRRRVVPIVFADSKGLTLEPGKRYAQTVEQSFHLSMAALDVKHNQEKEGRVGVMIAQEGAEYVVCTLSHKTLFQQPLDLNFTTGEEITFFLTGQGKVHLTGYQMEDEDDELDESAFDSSMLEEASSDEEDEEAPALVPDKGSKRKQPPKDTLAKKLKWLSPGDEEDDSDEEEEEDSDMEIYEEKVKKSRMEEEEEDSEEEENASAKPKKKEHTKQKATEQNKQAPTPTVDAAGDASESTKKKKKKKKKKKQDSESNESSQQASSQEQKDKPTSGGKTPKKQVLAGGTIMEEMKVGDGQVAKKGKMAHVYYVGRLAKNNVQFDSCSGGKPFRFRVGSNEVIQGWDNGVAGMKVGGKRRLTVPPQQGYGSQRQGPIPANSTLVFDVELKNVT